MKSLLNTEHNFLFLKLFEGRIGKESYDFFMKYIKMLKEQWKGNAQKKLCQNITMSFHIYFVLLTLLFKIYLKSDEFSVSLLPLPYPSQQFLPSLP